jgi:hypothetical protein
MIVTSLLVPENGGHLHQLGPLGGMYALRTHTYSLFPR